MKIRLERFNIYLLAVVQVCAVACQTSEDRKQNKEASTLRLFLEEHRDASNREGGVPVYRQSPIRINVGREPFLTEADVDGAAVVDMPGGFAIRVQFNGHGALVLEQVTVAHKGQHLAIRSDFGESRWLAAPLITRRISNGELVFTPDASREESERVVRGLSNVVVKIKKRMSGL